ncbi:MAG TPA: glycogen synthase, partial [Microbacterium sp.]|nr:glycogen synthase [Microbacterium sp.]
PLDPEAFVADLARVLGEVVSDRERAKEYGLAGRKRAVTEFSWQRIAEQTAALYAEVTRGAR